MDVVVIFIQTYSTPLDWINQRIKDEATVEEKRTDETQASFSDGQMPLRSTSVEVLGSRTSATTTIKME
uniref:Uncharacterized protein n=1 Tax=Panagrellus redivivus TaxID=6233 RepID=A0A7E4UWG9_PANRE